MKYRLGIVVVGVLLVSGCGMEAASRAPAPNHAAMSTSVPSSAPSAAPSHSQSPASPLSSSTAETAASTPVTDKQVVVLDPGHNGGNAAAPEEINKHVPAGRGRTKPCNTTGTASDDGYPEHAFTFDVAQRVRDSLEESGHTVVLTRDDDSGVGPCVNRRAEIGNEHAADAVVSIHADGHANAEQRGFHIAYSSPPLNEAQGEPALRLARTMRASLRSAGFPLATYIGSEGLSPRDDLAGMNLSERPAVLVECGNMRNPTEVAAMKTAEGRQRYADAITDGIQRYLRD